ncbi:YbbR-like domain-containing protein [Camelliibacillus cellulosilyticus]|uniref:YbbR-like domain-containing protein n=1 Tax=Camelliibacillus cellulosilyticus TaxID=2174486 RepID=A0ABV9GQF4_9BACL
MDKLFRNNWFIRIVSFLIALMLFSMVSTEDHPSKDEGALYKNRSERTETVIQDLGVKYDRDKYIVSGIPDKVKVELKGTINQLTMARLSAAKRVFVDLTNKKAGIYKVKVQTSGFPSDLKVTVIPDTISVTIQKRVTETFPISIDLLNKSKLEDGYSVGSPTFEPKSVSVTGTEKAIDRLAFVKGVVDLKGVSGSVNQTVTLNGYDRNGDQLNVTIDPAEVTVNVPIISPSKKLPVDVKPTGSLPDGEAIESITVDPTTVKVFGSRTVLDGLDKLPSLNLPLDGIDHDQTFDLDVPVPKGAEKVEPSSVKVHVKLSNNTTRTLKGVPIAVDTAANKDQTVTFMDPKDRTVDVGLTGAKSILNNMKQADIKVTIDVSNLPAGKHKVPIQVTAPDNVGVTLSQKNANVEIAESSKATG